LDRFNDQFRANLAKSVEIMSDNDKSGHSDGELMYIVCSNCGAWVDVKPGRINDISHGICRPCFDQASKELDEEIG
jgi:hypothetical protein